MIKIAKKTTTPIVDEVKKTAATAKAVIGAERTIKSLKTGKIKKVYLASNCSREIRDDIKHYAEAVSAAVVELEYPNEELGIMCQKPFPVSVLGVLKE